MPPPMPKAQPVLQLDHDELTDLVQLLARIDEFLRSDDAVARRLACFCSTGPGDTGMTAAYCLIDIFSFTVEGLRRTTERAKPCP
ncbi:hypothetical protein ACTWPT_51745 [Nonomuraea sp. 3N208]|uniref:hypothetical protein n=1 Tax=Nonomuraea sp. 3N208 TaxID=3457421 RepID=UPI003FD5F7EB